MGQMELEGCVLRSMDFKDKDRIYSLLTPSMGRVDVVARGARKSHKRFGGHLELFSRVQFRIQYREGRELHTLLEARQTAALPQLREDLFRFAIASYGAEIMLRTATSGQEDMPAFKTLLAWLSVVATVPPGWEETALRAGEVRFLAVRGVLASPLYCVLCGVSDLPKLAGVKVRMPEIALICPDCQEGFGHSRPIAPHVIQALQDAASGVMIHGAQNPHDRETLRALGGILTIAINDFLGSKPKSLSFLRTFLDGG